MVDQTDKDLDTRVRRYYRAQALTDERAAAIEAMAASDGSRRSVSAQPAPSGNGRTRRYWLSAAAVVGPLLLTGALTAIHWPQGNAPETVLDEIAKYHLDPLELDVESGDLHSVEAAMGRLDFPLRSPTFLGEGGSLPLIGARYCSLRGRLAVQLKLRDPANDRISTLFVAPVTDELREVTTKPLQHAGVLIRVQREDGLFFALARHPD